MTFGEKLKKLRVEQEKTQPQVAKFFSVATNTWSNYENDNRKPDLDMIPKIAKYFGVTTDYLLYEDSNEGNNPSFAAYLDKDLKDLSPEEQEKAKKDISNYAKFIMQNYRKK